MIILPPSVRRFLSVFLIASFCAFFSYIAYMTPYQKPGMTLSDIEHLENMLRNTPREHLIQMRRAGLEAKSWLKSCDLRGKSIVSELARHSSSSKRSVHAPKDDVFDTKTNSQYYFHAHRSSEPGHFHLFLWTDHVSGLSKPAYTGDKGGFVHLIAISTDMRGYPTRLFTTNQWVTGEDWRASHEVNRLVKNFEISHGEPSWPANRTLSAFVHLFAPQIQQLLELRDLRIAEELEKRPLEAILKDRSIDILSEVAVDIDAQLITIESALEAN